ncbi:MAG: hypothetical protein A2946_02350 [Candidatus Liptonbacteria bacterium RIFCSPLOWO2_01_FULL_53_13]|uniref:Type II secretion system protein GspG C-terminal domain-containing protein n=1 Tax=Candidatus Liptonbacteria bacterium RIFCSPLOWO2_01_FULL_53_13 TaxID=1798651 RepID=A0A1G2CH64_9BACT|nr:MAG: hypothetical protein A2946_02350 [Candidatus Liptonbacteria bacterium RIFCSPLOWO2_01_FULL_53_13]
MRKRESQKGFTLIEMLIVIAIVGILSSLVLVGLGPVQRQGRDARRISDLRQVQTALELYYAKNGNYPRVTTWQSLKDELTRTEGGGIGVKKIPDDPTSGRFYKYGVSADGGSYTLGAELEDVNNPNLDSSSHGVLNGVSCDKPVYCLEF